MIKETRFPNLKNSVYLHDVGVFLFLIGAWFLSNPYVGIWGDGVLYAGQALNRMAPTAFQQDIFFKYGSQDDFTIFPWVYAQTIAIFGIERAAFALTLLGKFLWVGGLLFFSIGFLKNNSLWIGLALALSCSSYYDGYEVFRYGESVLTSRLYAEAFVLIALGAGYRKHFLYGALFLALSMSMHPLVALPAVLLAFWVWWGNRSIKLLLTLTACVLIVGLSLAYGGISPLNRLYESYDEDWLSVVRERNVFIFMDNWSLDALAKIGLVIVNLGLCSRFETGTAKRFSIGLIFISAAFLSASWLGASIFGNVLITQLQLWRVLWLARLISFILLGNLLKKLWLDGGNKWILLAFIGCSLLLEGTAALLLEICGLILYFLLERFNAPKPSQTILAILALMAIASILVKLLFLNIVYQRVGYEPLYVFIITFVSNISLLSFVFLFFLITRSEHLAGKHFILVLGIIAFSTGLYFFDKRKDIGLGGETKDRNLVLLQKAIPENSVVLWPDNSSLSWLWLRRAHYVSTEQLAGALFSRKMVIEARRRQDILEPFGFSEAKFAWHKDVQLGSEVIHWRDDPFGALMYICHDSVLDYVLLPIDDDRLPVVQIKPVLTLTETEVFACSDFRKK